MLLQIGLIIENKIEKEYIKEADKHTRIKTAFFYNDKIYKQIESVSLESSLRSLLPNLKMTEL